MDKTKKLGKFRLFILKLLGIDNLYNYVYENLDVYKLYDFVYTICEQFKINELNLVDTEQYDTHITKIYDVVLENHKTYRIRVNIPYSIPIQ